MKSVALAVVLAAAAGGQEIRTQPVASGIPNPTDIQSANDGSGRLFLVQQNGVIRILRAGAVAARPFLDISAKTTGTGERGLLGLAFPPKFAQSQRFYIHYTDLQGNTTVSLYRVSTDPDVADPASEIVLLKVTQPFANHNGGQITFGPDGYFYLGLGDGGSEGDPLGNGQNRNTLLGKILRLDVESAPGSIRIPTTNPFVNTPGVRPEIWAYGLRNPWRFSFDRATGDLWIGDVGQNTYEEVDFQPATSLGGENYGWNLMEGLHCYTPGCSPTGLVLPIAEYTHAGGNCGIIGGFVYRGIGSPGLRGTYLYGDLCSGQIWGIDRQGTAWSSRQLLASGFTITSFGQDEAGEVYVANAANGTIYRIDGSAAPKVSAGGVVNAASFAPGLVAGSLATIFAAGLLDAPGALSAPSVPLPASLGGVSVTVGGLPAPILSIANHNGLEQVSVVTPAELAGRQTADVVVTRNSAASAAVTVPVLDIQPGVFTSDGTSAIVIHNADYSLVTSDRPLTAGEYVFLYATGLGRTASAAVDVMVANQPCDIQFAGPAPGFAGVYQVNFRMPTVPAGSQNLILTAGAAASPTVRVPVH